MLKYTLILLDGLDNVTEFVPIVASDDAAAKRIGDIASEVLRHTTTYELWRNGSRIDSTESFAHATLVGASK